MGPGCAPSRMPTQANCHHPRANTKPYALPHLYGWAQGVPLRGCPPRPTPGRTQNPMLCPTLMDGPRVCPLRDAHPRSLPPLTRQTRNPKLCPPRWMGPGCAPLGMPTQAHCLHPRANTKPYALPHHDGWAQGVSPRGSPPSPLPPLPGQT